MITFLVYFGICKGKPSKPLIPRFSEANSLNFRILAILLPLIQAEKAPSGSYSLGFTPFPHEISISAVEYAYEKIKTDGNIVCHHFDNGIPWPEALAGTAFHQEIMNDWVYRESHTPPGHRVYVAITPINLARNGLALYRAQKDDLPLPAPCASIALIIPMFKKLI